MSLRDATSTSWACEVFVCFSFLFFFFSPPNNATKVINSREQRDDSVTVREIRPALVIADTILRVGNTLDLDLVRSIVQESSAKYGIEAVIFTYHTNALYQTAWPL